MDENKQNEIDNEENAHTPSSNPRNGYHQTKINNDLNSDPKDFSITRKRNMGLVNNVPPVEGSTNETPKAENANDLNKEKTNTDESKGNLQNTAQKTDNTDKKEDSKKNKGKTLLNKFNPKKNKILLLIMGLSIFHIIIFIIILIVPLMALGIIDIEGLTTSLFGESNYSSSSSLSLNTPFSSKSNIAKISKSCEFVMVDGEAVSLEDYVAGVVAAEGYTSENIEALKAQAIAARTFVIYNSNFCQSSVENSSRFQNYDPNRIDDKARQAAEDTKGLVLLYDSKVFNSQYDSFYKGGDYSCDNSNNCSVTYTKLPNSEKHKVAANSAHYNQIAGGHGRGMSQVASYVLADSGMNYEEILKYFYSDGVEIGSLYGYEGYYKGVSASSDNFTTRNKIPLSTDKHDAFYWYSVNNLSYASGFFGECTWYAYGRANEILDEAGSTLNWLSAPDAKEWLSANSNRPDPFSYSTNVTEPKVGAIIVWGSSQWGHVAVVEAVNDDGTIDYSEGNISALKGPNNPGGYRYVSHASYIGTKTGTISHIWKGYNFLGYIYIIE